MRLGEVGLRNLTAEFYRRIRTDDLIGPMYPPDDWEGSERRLADFLCFRITGNPIYMETRGPPGCGCATWASRSTKPPATAGC